MLGFDLKEADRDTAGSVLVVDDVRVNRLILEPILSQLGCVVTSVDNGLDALRLAKEAPPDLALVDVLMPGMDGYEVCRQLKADSRTRDTPVIMVTSLNEIEDLETGFDAGAMDYIGRPFNPRELVVRVRNALQLKHQGDQLRRFGERMSRELQLAETLQETMLSMPPMLMDELHICSAYQPSLQVSGDFFDRLSLADGCVCFYVADVAGHGVAAAMLSSVLKALFTDVLHSAGGFVSPSTICNEVDSRFRRAVLLPSAYATAFVGIYDPATRVLQAMNCGHPSPILLSRDGHLTLPFEEKGSMPIGFGLQGDEPFEQADEVTLRLSPGALLFLYTDGLIEAQPETGGGECGTTHLGEVLQSENDDGSVPGICNRVIDALRVEGYQLTADDCSLMAVRAMDPESVLYAESVAADLTIIRGVGECIEMALRDKGWSERSAGAFRLVFSEYCNNAVLHGGCDKDDTLNVRVLMSGKYAVLMVRDTGPEWDYPRSARDAQMPDPQSEAGHGLAIIYKLVNAPCFFRSEGQNVAVLPVFRYASENLRSEGGNNVGETHDE